MITRIETSAGDTQARAFAQMGKASLYVAVVQAYEGTEDGARLGWGVLAYASNGNRAQWFLDRRDAAVLATDILFGFLKG